MWVCVPASDVQPVRINLGNVVHFVNFLLLLFVHHKSRIKSFYCGCRHIFFSFTALGKGSKKCDDRGTLDCANLISAEINRCMHPNTGDIQRWDDVYKSTDVTWPDVMWLPCLFLHLLFIWTIQKNITKSMTSKCLFHLFFDLLFTVSRTVNVPYHQISPAWLNSASTCDHSPCCFTNAHIITITCTDHRGNSKLELKWTIA